MENKKPHQIDDFFKNGLDVHSPPPTSDNWKKIASELEGEALDGFVKNHVDDLQPTPNPKIWNNIKSKLPLSLLVRNQLNWLSRIAAVLIIFMVALLAFDKNETETPNTDLAIQTESVVEDISNSKEEPVDFVFAINDKSKNYRPSASEELSLEDEKTIEDFWSGVMDDDEDFMADVDEKIIEKSLEPLLQLPIENLEAALPKRENIVAKKQLPIFQQSPFLLPNGESMFSDK